MEIVIDANIIFFILITSGKTEELLFEDNLIAYAPEFIFEELTKYKDLISEKTKRDDYERFLKIVFKQIIVVPKEEFQKHINKANEICPDKDDSQYFALALHKKCPIWSNDKALKNQKEIKVYNTTQLMQIFGISSF